MPIRYEDHIHVTPCSCRADGSFLFSGIVETFPKTAYFGHISRTSVRIADESGHLDVCWFNRPWISTGLTKGKTIRLFGKMHESKGFWSLLNPSIVTDSGIMPVYRLIRGIPAKLLRTVLKDASAYVDEACPEFIPEEILREYSLEKRNEALLGVHFPTDLGQIPAAVKRITFERMLVYQAAVACHAQKSEPSYPFGFDEGVPNAYWNSLPFRPTDSQKKVLDEVASDLRKSVAMHRLIQGDVGCGKTAVAFGAAYIAKEAGFQTAMMAPTEILARQHYKSALETLAPLGVRCGLLTGGMTVSQRRKILNDLAAGRCDVVFGTHALISKDVSYAELGLTITDEQHRFGVRQRSELQKKGSGADDRFPHVLVMSATPIPRTLALILYGDLDLSAVTDMPPGRMPVLTRIVPEGKRNDMYGFIRREINKGRQAYVVCPLVEAADDDENESMSAKEMFESLKAGPLAGLRIGLTWGSQKTDDKVKTLNSFAEGDLDILVATTVIEVGVNVPNATIMVIENAAHFGLSQLHQLRGRVGRGDEQGWCFLLSQSNERLRALTVTNDGFEIAKKDLEIRGPGDLLGTRQAGEITNMLLPENGIGLELLEDAVGCVNKLRRDPNSLDILSKLSAEADEYMSAEPEHAALN